MYIYTERDRERVITVKKTTYLKNILDSYLYHFMYIFIYSYISISIFILTHATPVTRKHQLFIAKPSE